MKKILTCALALAAVGTMSAQKAVVDQASKLSGKIDKIEEARSLIRQAEANPETQNDVRTYYVAGKLEFDAFDNAALKRSLDPNDPAADVVQMGNELINGYNAFLKALPLDSVPNEKGQVKPKHSKDMVGKMNSHHSKYFDYGGEMFNAKHYYPEAYNAFMIFGDLPSQPWADKGVRATPDSIVALAYHYAGIGAFSGNSVPDALKAFRKARLAGITDPKNFVYEIACWQNLVQNNPELEEESKSAIETIARDGYERFGISDHLFINNLVNALLQQERYDEAVALVNDQIAKTPDQSFLYGLVAYINDRQDNQEGAIANYRKAASFDNCDTETLVAAARKLYNSGIAIWNTIEGNSAEARAKRQDVKDNYWLVAKSIAERVQAQDPGNSDAERILDSVNYALETYFQ